MNATVLHHVSIIFSQVYASVCPSPYSIIPTPSGCIQPSNFLRLGFSLLEEDVACLNAKMHRENCLYQTHNLQHISICLHSLSTVPTFLARNLPFLPRAHHLSTCLLSESICSQLLLHLPSVHTQHHRKFFS